MRVARWWCPVARKAISLLPSFLAARRSGTLDEVEAKGVLTMLRNELKGELS